MFSWRRWGSKSAFILLTLLVGLPTLARAQFLPNLYTHRERNPCVNEPPFYKHVRRDYFGYYPTCWRRFPEGWACPSPNPELPDFAAELAVRPRDKKPDLSLLGDDDLDAGRGGRSDTGRDAVPVPVPGRGRGDGLIPPIPGERSPFSPDNARPAAPGGRNVPTPGGGLPPDRDPAPGTPGRPATPRSPDPNVPVPSPFDPQPAGPRADTGSSSSDLTTPTLPRMVSRRSSSPGEESDSSEDSTVSPTLGLPEIAPPSGSLPAGGPYLSNLPPSLPPGGVLADPASTTSTVDTAERPTTSEAPRRTSLLGGLFSQWNRRRR